MWALAVVVRGVDAQHRLEVAATEDEQPVETLGADGADEALSIGIRLRCADRHLDRFAAEDLVEDGAELAVAVVDEEAHPFEQTGG